MVKAFSYIRMSRPEQLKGDSMRRQLEAARKWASDHNLVLDDTLRDIGVSAYRGKNRTEGALRAFLDLVEEGRVPRGSYLIVESLDRLSREAVIDALPRFMDLIRAGIVVVTLMDGQQYSAERLSLDWSPLIVSLAHMARAHEESKAKSLRLAAAWREKKRLAAVDRKPMTSRIPEWLRLSGKHIEIIPERAAVVRRIFELAAGGMGRRLITKTLNRERVPAFRAKDGWYDSYVVKVLANEAAIGRFQPMKRTDQGRVPDGPPIDKYFPAVVSESLFWKAQRAKTLRAAAPGRRGATITNIFQGLLRCGGCGAPMIVQSKGDSKRSGGHRATCRDAMRGLGCAAKSWKLADIERIVLDGIPSIDAQAILSGGEHESDANEIESLRTQLEVKEKHRKRLMRVEHVDDDDAAVEAINMLGKEIKGIKQKLVEAERESKVAAVAMSWGERTMMVSALRKKLQSATDDELMELRSKLAGQLREMVAAIFVGPDKVAVEFHSGHVPVKRIMGTVVPRRPGTEAARRWTLYTAAPSPKRRDAEDDAFMPDEPANDIATASQRATFKRMMSQAKKRKA